MAWDDAFCQKMLELALSEENFEELKLECSIKLPKVTKEEIQQLTIEEDLNPQEKLIYILMNGQDVQKVYALENLAETITAISLEDRKAIFGLIDEMLSNTSSTKELLVISGNVLSQIVNGGFLDREIIITHFFENHIMKNLKSKDKEICSAWLEFLVASLKLLVPDDINKILAFLEENISLSCCSITRYCCCRIVSHLVEVVDYETIHSYLTLKMKALCQDIELEIRSHMCSELEHMISHVSKDVIDEYILPELMLLFQDEETSVREVSFCTLTNILPTLSEEYFENRSIQQLIINFYERTLKTKHPDDLIMAAKYIGKVLHSLKSHLTEKELSFLLECFQMLCSYGMIQASSTFDMENNTISFTNAMGVTSSASSYHNNKNDKDAQCRYWCAFNFPAVLVSIPIASFKTTLLPLFVLMTKDVHPTVRKTMALSLHEIGSMISLDVHFIFNSLKTILQDSDLEVVDAVLSHLPETLDCFLDDKIPQSCVLDLVLTLIDCQEELDKSLRWRTYEKLLHCFSFLHKHIPSDQIYCKIIPILQSVLSKNKFLPVKVAGGHALLVLMKHNTSFEERSEICKWLVTELAQSTCSRSRLLFLEMCYDICELFSKAFFKEHFYEVVMTMATDPVINIRLNFCKLLPLLKSRIKLPCDRLLLQNLEQTVRRIMALEKDPDVSRTIRNIILELDAVRLSIDGSPPNEEDVLDRKKVSDEENIIEQYQNSLRDEHGRSMSTTDKPIEATSKRSKRIFSITKERRASISKTKELTSSSKSGTHVPVSSSTSRRSSTHKAKRT